MKASHVCQSVFLLSYHMSPRFCWFSCTSTLFEPRVLVKLVPASRDVGLLDGLKHFETHLGLSEIGYPQNKRHGLSLFSLLFNDHSVRIPHFQTPFLSFFGVCLFVWLLCTGSTTTGNREEAVAWQGVDHEDSWVA